MKGAMVVNSFQSAAKFREPAEMISSAARDMGIPLSVFGNADLMSCVGETPAALRDVDFVLFWDKDVRLARNLELCGIRVFNSADCIAACDDKCLTHLVLASHGVPSIKTMPCPLTFEDSYPGTSFLDVAAGRLGFPMVVKDCFGSFGMQVHLARDMGELKGLFTDSRPRILQKYIECGSEDIRVEVIGGTPVAAVRRKGREGDFRSNSTLGGTMAQCEPSEDVLDVAVHACEAVGADFAGVDVIQSEEGPLVCEVNSNAHIKNLRSCTGRDVSYDILSHIRSVVG